jgi:ABC-type sugar transport system ATPase subunit
MMVGRELAHMPEATARPRDEVVLKVEGLRRDGVLDEINFELHRGEVLGVAGLRGAGRTELARAIFGADPISAGRVTVNGREVNATTPGAAVNGGIGLVPEDRKSQGLFLGLSSAQNIPVVRLASKRRWLVSPRDERRLAQEYVEKLRIRLPDVAAPVGTLSGGNQQKVVLAKWLEADVDVLILDEPTRGVDVGAKREIYEIIRALCARGVGVILISSELPEVLEMSDRILVMHQGHVTAEIDRSAATEELVMSHAVGGPGVVA